MSLINSIAALTKLANLKGQVDTEKNPSRLKALCAEYNALLAKEQARIKLNQPRSTHD